MDTALTILMGTVLVLGPLTLAFLVFVKRRRLGRMADESGLADMQIVYNDEKLEPPKGNTRRTHSIGFAISEMLTHLSSGFRG